MSGKSSKRLRKFAKTFGHTKATRTMKSTYRSVPRNKRLELNREMEEHTRKSRRMDELGV